MSATTVFVCTSCGAKEGKISAGNGKALLEALQTELAGDDEIVVQAVGCLSNCDRGVTVAITAADKFGWVSGEQSENADSVAAIAHSARAHVKTPDGFIAKTDRAKPVVARVPYIGFDPES